MLPTQFTSVLPYKAALISAAEDIPSQRGLGMAQRSRERGLARGVEVLCRNTILRVVRSPSILGRSSTMQFFLLHCCFPARHCPPMCIIPSFFGSLRDFLSKVPIPSVTNPMHKRPTISWLSCPSNANHVLQCSSSLPLAFSPVRAPSTHGTLSWSACWW